MDVNVLAHGPAAGFRMLVYMADIWIYQQALRKGIAKVRELASRKTEQH